MLQTWARWLLRKEPVLRIGDTLGVYGERVEVVRILPTPAGVKEILVRRRAVEPYVSRSLTV
jgi:hypothetical protein